MSVLKDPDADEFADESDEPAEDAPPDVIDAGLAIATAFDDPVEEYDEGEE